MGYMKTRMNYKKKKITGTFIMNEESGVISSRYSSQRSTFSRMNGLLCQHTQYLNISHPIVLD